MLALHADADSVDADRSCLGIVAPGTIDVGPATLCRLLISAVGEISADETLTLNDCATTGAATTANQICSILLGELEGAAIVDVFRRCKRGIVVSRIPPGCQIGVSYSGGSMNSIYERRTFN